MSYSTDFMGTIDIEWDKVAQLRSDQLFEIEMLDVPGPLPGPLNSARPVPCLSGRPGTEP